MKVATRAAAADAEIGGRRIKAGEVAHLLIGAANQDPARFGRPGEFDPEREPAGGLPFGHGIHYCPGASLATVLADAYIQAVLRHLGGRAFTDGAPVRQTGPTFTAITSLRVAWAGHPRPGEQRGRLSARRPAPVTRPG